MNGPDILLRVAARYERRPEQWHQGSSFRFAGADAQAHDDVHDYVEWREIPANLKPLVTGCCAFGLISRVAGEEAEELGGSATELLARWCQAAGFITIGDWNDRPERTVDEIIDGLREAAALR